MGEAVDVSRAKDEAAAELKGILAQLVLMMPRRAGSIAAFEIVAAKHMQQVGRAQVGDGIGPAVFIDEQRKRDARFLTENARIVAVAQADGGKRSAFLPEGLLVFAQLRDVLAAENSSIVPEKNDHGGLALPQRTQADFLAIGIGERDICKLLAESFGHGAPSLRPGHLSVKAALSFLLPLRSGVVPAFECPPERYSNLILNRRSL